MSAPDNEIPVALPANTLLARTDDVAVALVGLQVYTTGLAFHLAVRVRSEAAARYELDGLLWGRRRGHGPFLLGVELADGRRASSRGSVRHHDLVFQQAGGHGDGTAFDQAWWLSPLPPDGRLRVVVRCDELRIEESDVELDAAAVRRAADGVVELWPWSPPTPYEPRGPEPPDVPPDSWFAG